MEAGRGRARTMGMYVLAMVAAALVALLIIGASSREAAGQAGASKRTGDAAVGASVAHPADWHAEHERFTYDGTYGYTLWRPNAGPDDHGGRPAARVARAYGAGTAGVEQKVRETIAAYPDLKLEREEVAVGGEGLEGVAVGPIPGSTPSVEVYVEDEGSVYQINMYGETLDAEDEGLLRSLKFEKPSKSVALLGLKDGAKAESHQVKGGSQPSKKELEARRAAAAATTEAPVEPNTPAEPNTQMALAASSVPVYGESQIEEGCWRSASTFFYQTQHGFGANKSANGIATGFSIIGRPNFWGEYTHGNLGYGRCASTYYTNDKFAVDYPLDRGDYLFSPFSSGTVVFAGRATSHKNYGIFVVIKSSNGKYVSMSAHLNGLAPGIRPGAAVNADTIIGYAGDSGDPSIPVGEVHLHQAFYRYPSFNAEGAPYGGQGLQAIYHNYVGTAAGTGPGVYQFGWTHTTTQLTEGDRISN